MLRRLALSALAAAVVATPGAAQTCGVNTPAVPPLPAPRPVPSLPTPKPEPSLIDPCGCATPPDVGTVCFDGTVYVGLSPDGNVPMYTTRCDAGQTWNGSSCTGSRSSLKWGAYGTATGYTNDNTGKSNTANLVATYGTTTDPSGTYGVPAAQYCNSLIQNNRQDWYLPAQNELNVISTSREVANISNTLDRSGSRYWSSTEFINSYYARVQRMNDGNQFSDQKRYAYYVRCVRRD